MMNFSHCLDKMSKGPQARLNQWGHQAPRLLLSRCSLISSMWFLSAWLQNSSSSSRNLVLVPVRKKTEGSNACPVWGFVILFRRDLLPETSSYFLLSRILPHVHPSLGSDSAKVSTLVGHLAAPNKIVLFVSEEKRMETREVLWVYTIGYKHSRIWHSGGGGGQVNRKHDLSG